MHNYVDPAALEELKKADNLPAPSGVRLNIMRLCQAEDDVSLSDLISQIQADPVLAGRLIKIANGAGVNMGRQIVAVNIDVILMIGLDAVRQLTLAISLTSNRRNENFPGFDYDAFWSRSVAMACAGQALAEYYGAVPPTEMFASGLLANIGRLGLTSTGSGEYVKLLQQSLPSAELARQEKAIFGYNHLDLAAAMMQDWNVPRLFCEAVWHHEAPEESGVDVGSRQRKLIDLLNLSAAIADYCCASDADRMKAFLALLKCAERLERSQEDLVAVCDRIGRYWAEWGGIVHIQTRRLPSTRQMLTLSVAEQ
ncbi:HDOD domain-containing protein [Herbaspirillum lusitanum]|uniref:HDOD domain-containing protein n=1 Tax=Herbaspirillum lusitanum TaxID=213312 RepID=A0ABW9A6B8_9BURK